MLTPSTIVKFLMFDADAIKQIATSKTATWIGLLFVISAGFAREYDGEYLIAESWHLLIPVAASLIGCFSMVLLVHGLAWFRGVRDVSFFEAFRAFLNLYWMTAPLAWLYAIPVERFFDPGSATSANLILLAIVAFWRVALMVRCVQVLYNVHPLAAFFPVILFSDILAMAAIWLVPGPIFMIMGGVRLSESENLLLSVRIWMILIGYGTFLIWLIGYLKLCYHSAPWRYFKSEPEFTTDQQTVSMGTWALVAVSLLIWIPILPFTQSEQRLRWNSERLIRGKDFVAFSQLTRDHPEESFPPHWDPPPRLGYGETRPHVYLVVAGLQSNDGAQWMINRYAEKMEDSARGWHWMPQYLERFTDEELVEFVDAIGTLPNSQEIASQYVDSAEQLIANPDEDQSEIRTQALTRLRDLAPEEEAAPTQPAQYDQ